MKRFAMAALVVVLVLAACSRPESETATTTSPDTGTSVATAADTSTSGTAGSVPANDLNFATVASMANLYEIEASKLAGEKATGAKYKEFAQQMIQQHTEIGNSYKPIAEQQGLPMPTTLADISPEANFKTLYDQLVATAAGSAFDAAYRQQMIATHTAAVGLFEGESTTGQDPQLKAFAAQWLPMVKHHLEMAEDLPQAQ